MEFAVASIRRSVIADQILIAEFVGNRCKSALRIAEGIRFVDLSPSARSDCEQIRLCFRVELIECRGNLVGRIRVDWRLTTAARFARIVNDWRRAWLANLYSRGIRFRNACWRGIRTAILRRKWYSSIDFEGRPFLPGMFDFLFTRFGFNPPSCVEVNDVNHHADLFS